MIHNKPQFAAHMHTTLNQQTRSHCIEYDYKLKYGESALKYIQNDNMINRSLKEEN